MRKIMPLLSRSGLCLFAVFCGLSWARGIAAAEPLSFEEAAHKTLAANPDTQRFAFELEAARARVDTAALPPPIAVSAEVANAAGTGDARGLHSAEFTLSLTSVLERGHKRDARIRVGESAFDLLGDEQRSALLDLLAETGRRFVAVALLQERVQLAQAARAQADTTVTLIRPRVEAARSPRTELLNAEIERSRADVEIDAAEHDLASAQAALAVQWAAPDERPTVVLATFELPEPAPWQQLRSRLDALPDLKRYATERRLRDAQLALARAQSVPDWQWQFGVRRLQQTNEFAPAEALVAGITVPIGQSRRAASIVRESQAELAQVESSAEGRRLELERLLMGALEELQSARTRLQTITQEQLPRATEARDLTEQGYRIGRYPYRELAVAQQQVIELERARLEAAGQFHLTRIEVERLTGAQLDLLKE
jgi:cobalt-zinc-cadmium efflux system outer membrane protein